LINFDFGFDFHFVFDFDFDFEFDFAPIVIHSVFISPFLFCSI